MTTMNDQAVETYARLRPGGVDAARQFVLSHTHPDLQSRVIPMLDTDLATPGLTPNQAVALDGELVELRDPGGSVVGQAVLSIDQSTLKFAVYGATAPIPATVWNADDVNPNIVLSNGALTATATNLEPQGIFINQPGRANVRILTGERKFFSCRFPLISNLDTCGIGLANAFFDVKSTTSDAVYWPGVDYTAVMLWDNDTAPMMGNAYPGDFQINFQQGDIVDWAVDRIINQGWVRSQGGPWNGTLNGDPANGIGGFDITLLGSEGLFPMFTVFANNIGGAQVVGQFAAPFPYPPPAGFDIVS